MSMQQGASTVEELLKVVKSLARDMQEFSDCINGIQEITITIDEEDNTFLITSD